MSPAQGERVSDRTKRLFRASSGLQQVDDRAKEEEREVGKASKSPQKLCLAASAVSVESRGRMRRTLDVDLALEVGVVEDLHGDFLAVRVLLLERGVLDGDVLVDGLVGEDAVVAYANVGATHEHPVGDGGGETGEEEEEDIGSLEGEVGDEAGEEVRDEEDGGGELEVGEGAVALDGEGRVGDGRSVRDLESDLGVEGSPV